MPIASLLAALLVIGVKSALHLRSLAACAFGRRGFAACAFVFVSRVGAIPVAWCWRWVCRSSKRIGDDSVSAPLVYSSHAGRLAGRR